MKSLLKSVGVGLAALALAACGAMQSTMPESGSGRAVSTMPWSTIQTHQIPTKIEYGMADLKEWLRAVQEASGRDSGIVMTSIDERNKRIQIRMRPLRGGLERLEAAIAQVNVPREAVVVEIGCITDALNHLDKGKSPDRALLAAVSYSLEAPSQVACGKTVGLKLTLRNISDEPVLWSPWAAYLPTTL